MTSDAKLIREMPSPAPSGGSTSVLQALLGRCGQLVLNMATGMITARALKPDGRGELAAMILWPVFLSGAFTLGLPNALLYNLRMRRRSPNELIGTAMLLGLLLSFVTATLGFLLIPHWLIHYPSDVIRTAQWFMISTPATILLLIGRAAWEAEERFGTSSAALITPPIATIVGLVTLLMAHHLTPTTAAWTYVLGGIPPLVWVLFSLSRNLFAGWRSIAGSTRNLMSYGLRSYGIDLCGSLSQYVDQALVLGMLMPSDMGTYTVALSLSRMINVVFTATASVVFPKAMNRSEVGALRLALRAAIGSLAVAIPSATVLVFASRFALRLLYGPDYTIASGLLRVLLLEAIISGTVSILSQPFMAVGRPGTVTGLQVTGLASTVPLIVLLVPRLGAEGACVALLISACLRLSLLRICYWQLLPSRTCITRLAVDEGHSLRRLLVDRLRSTSATPMVEPV